jgi:alkylhydroperoxidase/carboxymuconolactone decarboxylase family protein YurZ
VGARFAAAKQAGATHAEIMEALYLAMRASARAAWTTIKNGIEGIDQEVKALKAQYEAEAVAARR